MAPKKSVATTKGDTASTTTPKPKPKGKAGAKRAREDKDDIEGAATPADVSTGTNTNATAVTVTANLPLLKAFEELIFYEFNFGDKFAALAHLNLVELLSKQFHSTEIKESKDIPLRSGETAEGAVSQWSDFVGRGHRHLIDEFLLPKKDGSAPASHTFARLESLKAEHNADGTTVTVTALNDASRAAIRAVDVVGTPLDAATKKKIAEEAVKYGSLTVEGLKAVLRTNLQPTTGVKAELIRRVSEGVVMGALPRCPHCFGGKMKFDGRNGIYHCQGFMDDDEYHFCYYRAASAESTPWSV